VKGLADCMADPSHWIPFSYAESLTGWDAKLRIFELWNSPATSPVRESEQESFVDVALAEAVGGGIFVPASAVWDREGFEVFRGHILAHRTFFGVPRNGSLAFEVGLFVNTVKRGGGWCVSDCSDPGFIACPFVELQVAAPQLTTSARVKKQRRH